MLGVRRCSIICTMVGGGSPRLAKPLGEGTELPLEAGEAWDVGGVTNALTDPV
jgi:hypothetical protein